MIIYAIEVLHHFFCSECKKWWSIGDHKDTELKNQMSCPHCGVIHSEYIKNKGVKEQK
jgi:DNA-directed RNA polymerase subunit RPC12/RpoP